MSEQRAPYGTGPRKLNHADLQGHLDTAYELLADAYYLQPDYQQGKALQSIASSLYVLATVAASTITPRAAHGESEER